MAILSTNAVQIARFANALYGLQLGSVTNAQVQSDITSVGGLDKALNAYYANSFGNWTTAKVAEAMLKNFGIEAGKNGLTAAAVSDASAYIVATLNAAAPAARGAAVLAILNKWASIADDASLSSTYGTAATAWNSSIDQSQAYTLSNTVDIPVSSGSTQGGTFVLTIGEDKLTGTKGNDVFQALAAGTSTGDLKGTLQSVDQINGGDGTDTLNLTLNDNNTTVAPALTSVEIINVRATDNNANLDLAAATGVSSIVVANSSTETAIISHVGSAALAVKNQNTDVNFDGSTATTLGLTLDTVGTGGATGTHIQVYLGHDNVAKATTLNVTANNANANIVSVNQGAVKTLNVTATGTNELRLDDAGSTATTIAVTGAGSVDFKAAGGALTALKTLTVGDGGVVVDATGGVLETATTGAGKDSLTAVGANVKSISTGGGADVVSTVTSGLAATAVVDLGAGDDTLKLSNAPTAGVTLAGGEGTDTLAVAAATYTAIAGFSTANLAKITGFETLSLTDALADASTVDLSKLAGLVSLQTVGVAAAGAATVSNVGANASVILKGDLATNTGALTVTLKDATGSSDTLNLTLNASYAESNDATATVTAVTETVTAAGVEVLNVVSTGTPNTAFLAATGTKADGVNNTLALTDTALVTLKVTGDQAFTFSTANAQTKLATIDASALTAGATISAADTTTATNAAITIIGSATAANDLSGSSNVDKVVGGAAADTLRGGANGDTLTGNGGNDTFFVGMGESVLGTGTFDTITDFKANTYGAGTNGAVDSHGAYGVLSTKLNGDLLEVNATADPAADILKVYVAANAADASTFLQNNKGEGIVGVALDASTGNLYIDNMGSTVGSSDGVADLFIKLTGVTTIDAAAILLV